MADTPQALKEFTDNLLSDLSSGALTVDEAMAACNQYSYIRESLATQKGLLSSASLIGEDDLKKVLTEILAETSASLAELPSFQQQTPDAPVEEAVIRNVGALRSEASKRVQESMRPSTRSYQESRRDFIHDLVTRYSSRAYAVSDTAMEAATDRAMAMAATEATNRQTKERFAEQLVASIESTGQPIDPEKKAALLVDMQTVVTDHEGFFTDASKREKRAKAIYETLAENSDLKRPDVLVDIALNAPETEPLTETLTRGLKLAHVADSLETNNGRGGQLRFFSADGTKGIAKGLQQGADGILSVVSDPVRDMVYHNKVNGVLKSMVADTQKFVDRLGEGFVKSSLFAQIGQDLTKQLSERQPTGGARSMVDDVFSSVFRGPLSLPLNGAVEDRILDYYELMRANANAPAGRKFMPTGLPVWDAFRTFTPTLPALSGGRRTGGLLPGLPFISLGGIGRVAGDAFSSVVDKTTSFLLTNPFVPQQLAGSRRAALLPTPFWEDMPLMIAALVILTILLLFVLPTPLNLSQVSHSSKIVSLLTGLVNKEGDQGTGTGSSVDCTQNPTSPLCSFKSCADCKWPTSGYITQGPNVTCDKNASHSSGSDMNAVDIGASGNVAVYAIAAGTVVSVNRSCSDNTGKIGNTCGGGYGNYVTFKTTSGYTVIYGHLKSAINPAVSAGASLSAGTQIGWMDQTGNSTGQHLHFGVISGGNVLDLPPDSPIGKASILGCVSADLKCSLVGKSCPSTPVSAQ